jgi:hypothetical protein
MTTTNPGIALPPLEYIIGRASPPSLDSPPSMTINTYKPLPPPQSYFCRSYSSLEDLSGGNSSPETSVSPENSLDVLYNARFAAGEYTPTLPPPAEIKSMEILQRSFASLEGAARELGQPQLEDEDRIMKRQRNTESAQRYNRHQR